MKITTMRVIGMIGAINMLPVTIPMAAGQSTTAVPPSDSVKLEEVIVTAERRSTDVQNTALSMSVLNGDELQAQGRVTLKQILQDVPGLSTSSSSTLLIGGGSDSAGIGVTIRGVQSNSAAGGTVIQGVPAVATYVDGVYEGVGGSYDIARVEVLRGPQGTLYGRSATGGVVAIYTNDPELGTLGGNALVEAGNYGLGHYSGALNIPMGDTLALRVSGDKYDRDEYAGQLNGAVDTLNGRAKLLFKPNDDLSALFGFAYQRNRTHQNSQYATLASPQSDEYVFTNYPPVTVPLGGENQFHQYWGKLDWDFGAATLTYLPAYRSWTMNYNSAIPPGALGSLTTPTNISLDTFHTQELRLSSNPGSKLTWQMGGFYYDNRLRASNAVIFVSGTRAFSVDSASKQTKSMGVFGEATYPFTDTWRVTAGLRYDRTNVDLDEVYTANTHFPPFIPPETLSTLTINGAAGESRFNNVTYKARLEHDLTVANMMYASVTTGFIPGDVEATGAKAPGPNSACYTVVPPPGAQSFACSIIFKAQTLTSYEIGSKNRFLDDSLQLNGAVYYADYGGYQTAGINISGSALNPQFTTLTVPATMAGAELELQYRPTPNDRIALSYGYTDASFHDIPPLFQTFVAQDEPINVAPHVANASYDHMFYLPGGSSLNLQGAVRYFASYDTLFINPTQAANGDLEWVRTGNQVIGDVSATWASADSRFSVSSYVHNVGNNRYVQSAQDSNDPPAARIINAYPYDPRTYGVVLGAKF